MWLPTVTVGVPVVVAIVVAIGAVAELAGRTPPGTAPLPAVPANASPRQALLDILGVLRRPQTKADLDPQLIRRFNHGPLLRLGSPVLSLMRL